MEQIIARSVDQLREVEGDRLDSVLPILVDKIEKPGDLAAIEAVSVRATSIRPEPECTCNHIKNDGPDDPPFGQRIADGSGEQHAGNRLCHHCRRGEYEVGNDDDATLGPARPGPVAPTACGPRQSPRP